MNGQLPVIQQESRLIVASKSGQSVGVSYDPAGMLREVAPSPGTTTQFLYDGGDLVAEYDSAGTVLRRYVHGSGVDEPLVWHALVTAGSGLALSKLLRAPGGIKKMSVRDRKAWKWIDRGAVGSIGMAEVLASATYNTSYIADCR